MYTYFTDSLGVERKVYHAPEHCEKALHNDGMEEMLLCLIHNSHDMRETQEALFQTLAALRRDKVKIADRYLTTV
jgi:hypothetical protein